MGGTSFNNDLEFFRRATQSICSSLNIEDGMISTLAFLGETMPVHGMSVHRYREDLNDFQMLAIASREDAKEVDITFGLPPELKGFALWQEESNIKLIHDSDDSPVAKRLVKSIFPYLKLEKASILAIRLDLKDRRRVADVCIYARGSNRYTENHARLFSLLNEPFAIAFANFLAYRQLRLAKERLDADNQYLRRGMFHLSGSEVIGESQGMKRVIDLVRYVAPMDTPVLLTGETGVGKEVVANAIQQNSGIKEGPFIKVNCGAVPESLIDSELFGHEKGAFTGATEKRRGRFELADGGTIFLDEIGEMPLSVQVRLLRVLQDGTFERVGGSQPVKVNIRVIAATHRDMQRLIEDGKFRQDLYFRLNVFPIHIPPLRERDRDIPHLVKYFISKACVKMNLKIPEVAESAAKDLLRYNWPGNVRELENIVVRSLILHQSGPLSFAMQTADKKRMASESAFEAQGNISSLDEAISNHIKRALDVSKGKVQGPGGAAEILQVNPNTLRKRMMKLGVPYGRRVKNARQGSL